MDIKRFIVFGGVIMAMIIGISVFAPKPQQKDSIESAKPSVTVSTFALLEASRAVAGDLIDIHTIVPPGSDAHMFAPNPTQIAELSHASLFIYNGAGFETWAENLTNTFPKTTKVIDMSQHVTLLKSKAQKQADEHEEHGQDHDHEEHDHHHGVYDPHYWLDIDNMIKITQTIDVAFSNLLPANAQQFHTNAAAYIAELQKLKSDYATGFAVCQNRTLVSNHDAFGYLAHTNKLENVSVIGLSSDEQPSAQTMAHVVEVVKEHGMKTIFFEALVNDNVSQTIAKETGAKAVSLQPLENISEDELKSHQTYLSIMRENLKKLREAMECR